MGDSVYATRDPSADIAVKHSALASTSESVVARAHRDAQHAKSRDGENELDRNFRVVEAAFTRLFKARYEGIRLAQIAASGYERPIHHDSDLAFRLAMLGIDLATTFISAGVGKAVEIALVTAIEDTTLTKILSSAVGTAVKEGVKSAAKAVKPSAHEAYDTTTDFAVAKFFQTELDSLDTAELAASHVVFDLSTLLAQSLGTIHHDQAFAAIAAIEQAVVSQVEKANSTQAEQSAQHWIRYVAHSSMGGQPKADALTNVAKANQPPTEQGPQTHFDGLLDLHFTCSIPHPDQDPRLVLAEIRGVKREAVEMLRGQSLLDAQIPVRAIGAPDGNNAVLPIVVVRDEAGNISFEEDPNEPVAPSRWLAARGVGDPTWGARRLLSDLLANPLGQLLRSDDVSKREG